jgi:predicted amino acid racemase
VYPRLVIDMNKLKSNLDKTIEMVSGAGCSVMIVTKGYCADLEIFKLLEESSVEFIADSRIQNLKKYEGTKKQRVLLRLPMGSEADEVVNCADISLNSELSTIIKLNEAAKIKNIVHV